MLKLQRHQIISLLILFFVCLSAFLHAQGSSYELLWGQAQCNQLNRQIVTDADDWIWLSNDNVFNNNFQLYDPDGNLIDTYSAGCGYADMDKGLGGNDIVTIRGTGDGCDSLNFNFFTIDHLVKNSLNEIVSSNLYQFTFSGDIRIIDVNIITSSQFNNYIAIINIIDSTVYRTVILRLEPGNPEPLYVQTWGFPTANLFTEDAAQMEEEAIVIGSRVFTASTGSQQLYSINLSNDTAYGSHYTFSDHLMLRKPVNENAFFAIDWMGGEGEVIKFSYEDVQTIEGINNVSLFRLPADMKLTSDRVIVGASPSGGSDNDIYDYDLELLQLGSFSFGSAESDNLNDFDLKSNENIVVMGLGIFNQDLEIVEINCDAAGNNYIAELQQIQLVPCEFDCTTVKDHYDLFADCNQTCFAVSDYAPSPELTGDCFEGHFIQTFVNPDDDGVMCAGETYTVMKVLYFGEEPIDTCTYTVTVHPFEVDIVCAPNVEVSLCEGQVACYDPADYIPENNYENCGYFITQTSGPTSEFCITGGESVTICFEILEFDIGKSPGGNSNPALLATTCCITFSATQIPFTYQCPPDTIEVNLPAGACTYSFPADQFPAPTFGQCPPSSISANYPQDYQFPIGVTEVCYNFTYAGVGYQCCFLVIVNPGNVDLECHDDIVIDLCPGEIFCFDPDTLFPEHSLEACGLIIDQISGPETLHCMEGSETVQLCFVIYSQNQNPNQIYITEYDTCCINITTNALEVEFTCPALTVVERILEPGQCFYTFAVGELMEPFFYECQPDSVTNNIPPGNSFPEGSTEVCFQIYSQGEIIGTCCYTVVIYRLPANIISNSPVCENDTLHLSVDTDASGYLWGGPGVDGNTEDSPSITDLTPGVHTYCVTLTYVDGTETCTQVACTNVTIFDAPEASITTNEPICEGSALILTAAPDGQSYEWSGPNGVTAFGNPLVIPLANPDLHNGTYQVITTSQQGCRDTADIFVDEIVPTPEVSQLDDIEVCHGESIGPIMFTTIPADAIVNWTNTNPSIGLGATGTDTIPAFIGQNSSSSETNSALILYFPFVMAGNEVCQGEALDFEILVRPQPDVSVTANTNPICSGQNLILTASGADTYTWDGPEPNLPDEAQVSVNNIQLDDAGNYIVVGTNEFGCIGSDSILITVNPSPTAIILPEVDPVEVCTGSTLILSGEGGTSYLWNTPSAETLTDQVITFNNANDDQHEGIFTLVVTTSEGCSDTTTKNVLVNPLPEVNILADKALYNSQLFICLDSSVIVNSLVDEAAITSYQWHINDQVIDGATEDAFEVTTEGGSLSLMVVDTNGCAQISEELVVNVENVLNYLQIINDLDCSSLTSGAVNLMIEAGSGILPTMIHLTHLEGITQDLSVLDTDGNEDFLSLTAGNYVIVAKDTIGCIYMDTLQLSWPNSNIAASDDYYPFKFSSPENFDVLLNDGSGSPLPDNVILIPNGNFYPPQTIDLQNLPTEHDAFMGNNFIGKVFKKEANRDFLEFYFQAFKNDFYEDTFVLDYQILDPTCLFLPSYAKAHLYIENNCIDGTDAFVNVITPDGDGINDQLVIPWFPDCNITEFEFAVYNRWGGKVYHKPLLYTDVIRDPGSYRYSNFVGEFWAGTTENGQVLPSGTYYYVINFSYIDDKTGAERNQVIKNFVEVIRKDN